MKTIGIIGLLLLAAIATILGIMASEGKPAPPIVNVEPVTIVEAKNEFAPLIDIFLDPVIDVCVELTGEEPRYTEEMVRTVMRDYDYPWLPIKPLKIEHHGGRIWYVYATFQNTTRLYIFDEPL